MGSLALAQGTKPAKTFAPTAPKKSPTNTPMIHYRIISHTQTYNKASSGQHVAIKVTPPQTFGPGNYVIVEIYNYTSQVLSQVDFDIYFINDSWQDFEAKISAEDLLAGRSALRKVSTGTGTGKFPTIKRVRVNNLNIYNIDASKLKVKTYVDLVRIKKGK